jgi:hypothetical protein
MANTYFNMEKTEVTGGCSKSQEYTNNYKLTLTAFRDKTRNSLQLTVSCDSTIPNQSGIGFIALSEEEVDKLIFGLLERRMYISTTGDEQSNVCPDE